MVGLGAEAWATCRSQSNPLPHPSLVISVWPLKRVMPGLLQWQPLIPQWFQCGGFDVL